MSKESEIKRLLREIVGTENYLLRGTVTKITGQTCSVKLASGLEVSDVKLKALVTNDNDYYILFPSIGSGVLLLMENNDLRNLTVVKVDKVTKFEFSQNGLIVEFDSEAKKVAIKNNDTSLLNILKELSNVLKGFKVNTTGNAGPSTNVMPDTLSAISQFETMFNKLLK